MFFYPASMDRFALPLMFIIDPVFWLLCWIGFFLIKNSRNTHLGFRKTGLITASMFLFWWLIIAVFKYQAAALSFTSPHRVSYPGPLAPLSWLVIDKELDNYKSAVVSFFDFPQGRVMRQSIPEEMVHDEICLEFEGNVEAERSYQRYQQWAQQTICIYQEDKTCICHSMRYAFNITDQEPYFGSVRIDESGELSFLKPDSVGAWETFKHRVILGDAEPTADLE